MKSNSLILLLFSCIFFSCEPNPKNYLLGRIVSQDNPKDEKFKHDRSYPNNCVAIDIDDDLDIDYGVAISNGYNYASGHWEIGQIWYFQLPGAMLLDDGCDYLLQNECPEISATGKVTKVLPDKKGFEVTFPNYPTPCKVTWGPIGDQIKLGDSVGCGPYLAESKGDLSVKNTIVSLIE